MLTASSNDSYPNAVIPLTVVIKGYLLTELELGYYHPFFLDVDLIHGYHRSGSIEITERQSIKRTFFEALGFSPVLYLLD